MSRCAQADPLADELPEEQAGGEHAAVAVALVGEVGRRGLELGAQRLGQRHRPGVLAGGVGGGQDRGAEAVVVAHDGGDLPAERDDLGAGEGGDVDDPVGVLLAGEADAVAEHHPALGVGVEDLDAGAVAHDDDVARALRGAARHVLGEAEVAGDRDGQVELGGGEDRPGDRGRARHVALHRDHAGGRLDVEAAAVEGDALADERHRRPRAGGGPRHRDDPRRVHRALPDARRCRRSRPWRGPCRRGRRR